MSAPTLRPYQAGQLEAVCDAREKGTNRVLIKSPTGTGKTVTFAAMLKFPRLAEWLHSLPARYRGAKMLVIAHREELLDQAAEKIQRANPGLMVSIEQGDRVANRYSDVVIASIQTLAARKFARLKRLLEAHTFRLVIVDEAHHAAAPTYRTALVHLGFLPPAEASDQENLEAIEFDDVAVMEQALKGWDDVAPKDRLLVGVTATPNRSDAIGLGCVFQTIAYSYALKDAIADGWLVPIKPWVVETDLSLDTVRTSHGDFNQKDLAETVNTDRRNQLAVTGWREYAEHLPTIAFTVDVAHAHALARAFEDAGYRARAVSGETPKDDRRQILRAYTEGQIDVITNCMVLTEGTDLPLTRCILHAKPTKSATLYEQMTGRGLRLFAGKPECVVIDIVDVARRHSLQAAPVLYGLPPGVKTKGEDLKSVAATLEQLREKYPTFDADAILAAEHLTLEQLRARATTFDVWAIPDLGPLQQIVSMRWIKLGEDRFKLAYPWQDGTETLEVSKDLLGHFELVATFRSYDPNLPREKQAPARQRTLAAQVTSAAAALQLAEAYVHAERRSAARLTDTAAPWREGPASEKQVALLSKCRIPHNPKTVTKGQASDLLDLHFARKGQRGAFRR
jgi:superfamily II DNA or RNA helicase